MCVCDIDIYIFNHNIPHTQTKQTNKQKVYACEAHVADPGEATAGNTTTTTTLPGTRRRNHHHRGQCVCMHACGVRFWSLG